MGDTADINKVRNPNAIQGSGQQAFLHVRDAIGYALLYVVASAIVSYLFSIPIVAGSINLKRIIIPASSHLLLGLLFTGFLSKLNLTGSIKYAIVTIACIFIVTSLIGTITKNGSALTSLFYSCLFLIPYMVHQTWSYYKRLSGAGYHKIWHLQEHNNHAPVSTIFLNSLKIKIKIAAFNGDAGGVYKTTVPGKASFGSTFTNFIYEKEKLNADRITVKDGDNHQLGWQFFTPDFFGLVTRPIDPDLNLYANNIRNNSTIIAKRTQNNLHKL